MPRLFLLFPPIFLPLKKIDAEAKIMEIKINGKNIWPVASSARFALLFLFLFSFLNFIFGALQKWRKKTAAPQNKKPQTHER